MGKVYFKDTVSQTLEVRLFSVNFQDVSTRTDLDLTDGYQTELLPKIEKDVELINMIILEVKINPEL